MKRQGGSMADEQLPKNIVQQYSEILETVTNTKQAISDLESKLKRSRVLEENQNISILGKALDKKLQQFSADFLPYTDIQNVMNQLIVLVRNIEDFNDSFTKNNYFEIQRQIAVREAERKDAWKLYRDRLGRWVLGVCAAVVLYSAFVALSHKWDFIKVPVRDIVLHGKNDLEKLPKE